MTEHQPVLGLHVGVPVGWFQPLKRRPDGLRLARAPRCKKLVSLCVHMYRWAHETGVVLLDESWGW